MITKPQLIAVGFIVFGLILFALSIFLITKEYSSRQPVIAGSTPANVQVSSTPALANSKKTAVPKPTREPTPEPTPTPVPVARSTVKQIAKNRWLVFLTSQKWFETGIPVIANDTININTPQGEPIKYIQYRINNTTYFSVDGRQLYMFEEHGIGADFKDTLKLRLTGETAEERILVIIDPNAGSCLARDDENHKALHNSAIRWADMIKTR